MGSFANTSAFVSCRLAQISCYGIICPPCSADTVVEGKEAARKELRKRLGLAQVGPNSL